MLNVNGSNFSYRSTLKPVTSVKLFQNRILVSDFFIILQPRNMANLTIIVGVCLALTAVVHAGINGDCPLSSQHTSCAPKCVQDSECSSTGGKCCPNLCNQKSCVRPQVGSNTAGSGYKGSTGGAGAYCGNVKCNAYEKCDLDKSTKRMKCVRA